MINEEAPYIKDETASWLLEQRVQLEKDCRSFLTQEDASSLFQDCNFYEICNKDEFGNVIMTSEYYFQNACWLSVHYKGAAQTCRELKNSEPLWQEVTRCRLMVAAFLGEERLIRWLLENVQSERENINYISPMLGSALFAAVFNNMGGIVSNLIEYKVDPHATYTWREESPLSLVVVNNNISMVKVLLRSLYLNPNEPAGIAEPPLLVACFNGFTDIVEILLQHPWIHPDIQSQVSGFTPLTAAVRNGNTNVVRVLVNSGLMLNMDPNRLNDRHECPLYAAAKLGDSEIVSHLLRWPTIDPNILSGEVEIMTPLRVAVGRSDETTAGLLLQFPGIDPHVKYCPQNESLLLMAAKKGLINVVFTLLEREGFDVNNTLDAHEHNVVSLAAFNGHVELLGHLLQRHDINLDIGYLRYSTCLLWVRHWKIMEILLRYFPDRIDKRDRYGRTALMEASQSGYYRVAKVLLDFNADFSLKDKRGRTALMEACLGGHRNIAEKLLRAGADPSVRDREGYSALDLARSNGFERIEELLS